MTDNEIIKALEYCDDTTYCAKDCHLKCLNKSGVLSCRRVLKDSLLDLINRQKAEIERLKKGWKADVIETSNIKADAIKEFAEKLKEKYFYDLERECLFEEDIDDFVKEMVGDS
jgi:hypothetical protein